MKKKFLCLTIFVALATLTACSGKEVVTENKPTLTPTVKVEAESEKESVTENTTEPVKNEEEIVVPEVPTKAPKLEFIPPENPPVLDGVKERIEFTDDIPSEDDFIEVYVHQRFQLSDTIWAESFAASTPEDEEGFCSTYLFVRGTGRVPDRKAEFGSYLTAAYDNEYRTIYDRVFTFTKKDETELDNQISSYKYLIIDEGITELGEFSLAGLNCHSIYFPSTLKKIDKGALFDTVSSVDQYDMRYDMCYNLNLEDIEVGEFAFGFSGTLPYDHFKEK